MATVVVVGCCCCFIVSYFSLLGFSLSVLRKCRIAGAFPSNITECNVVFLIRIVTGKIKSNQSRIL